MNRRRRRTVTACFLTLAFGIAALPAVLSSFLHDGEHSGEVQAWVAGFNGTDGVLMQKRELGCGPAALAMIFAAEGIPASLDSLAGELGLTSDGTSMQHLKIVAERHRMRVGAWRFNLMQLRHAPLPAILFLKRGHFVVLDSVGTDDRAYIRDPAVGRIAVEPAVLTQLWKGETLVFEK